MFDVDDVNQYLFKYTLASMLSSDIDQGFARLSKRYRKYWVPGETCSSRSFLMEPPVSLPVECLLILSDLSRSVMNSGENSAMGFSVSY